MGELTLLIVIYWTLLINNGQRQPISTLINVALCKCVFITWQSQQIAKVETQRILKPNSLTF